MFSNKPWANEQGFISYYECNHSQSIKKGPTGRKQWGRKRGIYSKDVEHSLDQDLENKAAPIFEKLISIEEISISERKKWAHFLLSQIVRTPSFIEYEQHACDLAGIDQKPDHDRVGCEECGDLHFVANRDWCYLFAHEDDYFVRTDNPVLLTGFIERPETCLFYPLTPKICLSVCSMHSGWNPYKHAPQEMMALELSKGMAHMFNFHLAKCTQRSLIISPEHDGLVSESMFKDILGMYPQPPFPIHVLESSSSADEAYESVRRIMCSLDGIVYPEWSISEIEPFYRPHHREGVAYP